MKRAAALGATLAGVAGFAYAMSALGATAIQQAIARVGWGFAAILLISSVRELAKAAAWAQTFTGPHHLSVAEAFRARLAGESLSALMPMGFLVGEPAKAHYVGDRVPFATAFSGLLLEYAFYTVSLAVFAVVALFLLVPPRYVLAGLGAAAAIVLVVKPLRRTGAPVRRFVSAWPKRAALIGALELAYHALGFVETYLVLRWLSPAGATWRAAVAFEAISRGVSIAFKMVPLRVGVDEAGAAFMATWLAITPATGVMLALVRKLRVLFWAAVGLLAIVVRVIRRWAPARTFDYAAAQKPA